VPKGGQTINAPVQMTRVQPAAPPRAQGRAEIDVAHRAGLSRLARLHQAGSLRVLFPRGSATPTAMLLNTAGGLTGGDRMEVRATAGPRAALRLTTQAAERAYAALPGSHATVETRLSAGPGGRVDWLPQETILYDRAALHRRLEVDLTGDATALIAEALILGRAAHGETVRTLSFRDRVTIRRDGRPVHVDGLRLEGDATATLAHPATGGGARAMALVVFAGPRADGLLDRARAVLRAETPPGGDDPVHAATLAGVSLAGPDLLVARLLAADGFALRRVLVPLLTELGGVPLPTCWRL
jgi:urease accessory protein